MEERQRRSFTEDYKLQAVELVVSSRRSVTSVVKRSVCATRCCGAGSTRCGRSRHRRRSSPSCGLHNRTGLHSAIGYIASIEMELKAA